MVGGGGGGEGISLILASWRDWGEFGKDGGVFLESFSRLQSNPVQTGAHGIVINEQVAYNLINSDCVYLTNEETCKQQLALRDYI